MRSFRAEWCEKYSWLHYDTSTDAAYCYICMKAELGNKFLASTKRDPAFISKGFKNWKDATIAFNAHLRSDCHKEGCEILELRSTTNDVAENSSKMYKEENELNRMMLIKFLQNVRFLARQGLSLSGHKDDEDSNFTQLLLLRSIGCPEVLTWMKKKTNKYTSGDIQNEFLQVMALHIMRNICSDIVKNGFYTIMADECTDVSNKEQFVVCIRWVDNTTLIHHEDCVGLYGVDTIDSNTLMQSIEDVLLRMGLLLSQCHGQCYDGASNMAGCKNGVATQIQAKEKKAILTHCYGHALNLAVSDCIK